MPLAKPVVSQSVYLHPSIVFKMAVVLLAALILLSTSFTVESIKCWVCKSDVEPRCVDPFDNITLPIYDCAQERHDQWPDLKATMCRKMRQKEHGKWLITRSCAFMGSPGEEACTSSSGTDGGFVETCTCNDKDGCNTATTHQYSHFLAALLLLLLFIRM